MSRKREIVSELMERGISEGTACRAVGVNRSSYQYKPKDSASGQEGVRIRKAVIELAHKHRRYGYRRVTALLRRRGDKVNHKRIWRIWRSEGLSLPRRRPGKRRANRVVAHPTKAEYRGHVWTYDFLFDRSEKGQQLKMLTVLDEYTRECHRIKVAVNGAGLDSEAVIETLAELFELHGAPAYLRSDNGGEFIAHRLGEWLVEQGTSTIHIEPGHPWENGYGESFNGKFRDECLNEEVFWNWRHAQVIVEGWRRHYNEERPHSSLGYRTPSEVAAEAAGCALARAQLRIEQQLVQQDGLTF